MEDLFKGFQNTTALLIGLAIGALVYFYAGRNLTYAIIAMVIGVIVSGYVLPASTTAS